jgi:hypothetical protein
VPLKKKNNVMTILLAAAAGHAHGREAEAGRSVAGKVGPAHSSGVDFLNYVSAEKFGTMFYPYITGTTAIHQTTKRRTTLCRMRQNV